MPSELSVIRPHPVVASDADGLRADGAYRGRPVMVTGHAAAVDTRRMQIGEAAERVGLSIRTIRHYEEAGLVVPSARSEGGFRLYTEPDLDRLRVIKRMKPLGFTLDEMRDLLQILDSLISARGDRRDALLDRLVMFHTAAQNRVDALRAQLTAADEFARQIRGHLDRSR